MRKTIFTAICFIGFGAAVALAGEINISASVEQTAISLDDQLVLRVEVSGDTANLPAPQIPDIPNFTVYSSGRSQNFSIVNGKVSSSTSFRYVLAPRAKGKFSLPPVTVQHDNRTYATQPIAVEVTEAGKAPPQAAAIPGAVPSAAANNRQLFVTASVDKPTAYVNEQLSYTFRFYRKIQLLSNPQYNPPDFSGFWTEDTPPKNYYTTVNGEKYVVAEVKMLLFPTRPGRFTLGNATLQCSVEDFNPGDDFFRSFFAGGKTQVLRTDPISVNVLALPDAGKPADFSGAVGQFTMSASLDRKTVNANEPVTLSCTVKGTGSIKTIEEPKLPDWPDFRKYETVSSLDMSKDAGTLQGAKTFKTVIVPLTPGRKTLAPLAFSFFDPSRKQYRTVTTAGFELDVAPAKAGATSVALPPSAGPAAPVKVINRDIRYLKTLTRWAPYSGPLYKQPWFIALNLLPLLLLIGSLGYLRWTERLSSDVAFARRLQASGTAKRYLKKAKGLLAAGNCHDYHAAISRALLTYIADKTNLSADGLTISGLSELLAARNVTDTTITKVKAVLNECDMARFAPVQMTAEQMDALYSEAAGLIGILEKELK
jgi:hypothetical protein